MTLLVPRAFARKETEKGEGEKPGGGGGVRGGTGINETTEGELGAGGGGSELETSGQLELESAPNRISVSDLLIIYSRCNFSYQ